MGPLLHIEWEMTNRDLSYIARDQKPLICPADVSVSHACRAIWERRAGSVLVVNNRQKLVGIFTGRDAVHALAKSTFSGLVPLSKVMTRNPVTITPKGRAIDALRAMSDGGFRHLPVTENGDVQGVVSRGDLKGMEFEEYRWQSLSRTQSQENRGLTEIIEGRKPLILAPNDKVADACRAMWKHKAGSVLIADARNRLKGIFTGRDVVRVLARSKSPADMMLSRTMTRDPATIAPDCHAIDALRTMNDCGFRHLPVVDQEKILGVISRSDFTGREIDHLDEEEHLRECIW